MATAEVWAGNETRTVHPAKFCMCVYVYTFHIIILVVLQYMCVECTSTSLQGLPWSVVAVPMHCCTFVTTPLVPFLCAMYIIHYTLLVAITTAGCYHHCWLLSPLLVAITTAGCFPYGWLLSPLLVAIATAGCYRHCWLLSPLLVALAIVTSLHC